MTTLSSHPKPASPNVVDQACEVLLDWDGSVYGAMNMTEGVILSDLFASLGRFKVAEYIARSVGDLEVEIERRVAASPGASHQFLTGLREPGVAGATNVDRSLGELVLLVGLPIWLERLPAGVDRLAKLRRRGNDKQDLAAVLRGEPPQLPLRESRPEIRAQLVFEFVWFHSARDALCTPERRGGDDLVGAGPGSGADRVGAGGEAGGEVVGDRAPVSRGLVSADEGDEVCRGEVLGVAARSGDERCGVGEVVESGRPGVVAGDHDDGAGSISVSDVGGDQLGELGAVWDVEEFLSQGDRAESFEALGEGRISAGMAVGERDARQSRGILAKRMRRRQQSDELVKGRLNTHDSPSDSDKSDVYHVIHPRSPYTRGFEREDGWLVSPHDSSNHPVRTADRRSRPTRVRAAVLPRSARPAALLIPLRRTETRPGNAD
jgi:hypothetical protein